MISWNLAPRLVCAALLLAPVSIAPASGETTSTKPNIIFIISDDHRHDCLGVNDNPNVKTPHLDKLAMAGVNFRQATVISPQCSPNRSAILTGLPPHQSGWLSNDTQTSKVKDRNGFAGLDLMPKLIQAQGYETVFVGKWHLASDPWNCGFSNVRTWLPAGGGSYKNLNMAFGNTRKTTVNEDFTQSAFGKDAAAFLEERKSGNPFFMWVAFTAPHSPVKPNPKEFDQLYTGKSAGELIPPGFVTGTESDMLTSLTVRGGGGKADKLRKTVRANGDTAAVATGKAGNKAKRAQANADGETQVNNTWPDYYASISALDAEVGRITQALDKAQLTSNTMIVFMGDNGMMRGSKGWAGKVIPYEESIRVPLIVWGPLVRDARQTSDSANSLDLPATFVKWAGGEIPQQWYGRDISPALGYSKTSKLQFAISEFADNVGSKFGEMEYRLIRTPTAKLIKWRDEAKGTQYFDLTADPRELTNRIDDPTVASEVAKLKTALEEFKSKTKDPWD